MLCSCLALHFASQSVSNLFLLLCPFHPVNHIVARTMLNTAKVLSRNSLTATT